MEAINRQLDREIAARLAARRATEMVDNHHEESTNG
jgi:hypothetical protein